MSVSPPHATPPRRRGGIGWAPALLAVAAIFLATLTPIASSGGGSADLLCPWCDRRALADLACNVLLFAPLGAMLVLRGWSLRGILMAGAGLSLLVEAGQFAVVPGRDANPFDVLANAAGAGFGALVLLAIARWGEGAPRRAARTSLAAAALTVAVLAGGGALLAPSFPLAPYRVEWLDPTGSLEPYRGRVAQSALAGAELEPGPARDPAALRDALAAGDRLSIRAVAGPPPVRLAQLFAVSAGEHGELFFVGSLADRDALLSFRTRSAAWRLDRPALIVPGALSALRPGEPFLLETWSQPDGRCLSVNGTSTCGLGYTLGGGWMTLFFTDRLGPPVGALIGAAYLALLLLPMGMWLRARRESALALGVAAAGLWLLPASLGLLPTPGVEWLGAAVGTLLGVLLRGRAFRSLRPLSPCLGGRVTGVEPAHQREVVKNVRKSARV